MNQENEEIEDIEKEEGNDEVVIDVPFDPNKIKVRPQSYSVGQIVQDIKDEVINLNTEFQRLPNLWDDTKKSRLIESFILNLPIPAFYFNEKEENDWEVIDGLQRISTLKSFIIDKKLILKNLEFLKEFEGFKYDDLPNPLQKRISRFPLTIYIIEKGTPNAVKFNLFRRVNTAGLMLTPQEIRHAINQGIPAELIADLARGHNAFDEAGNIRKRKNFDGTVVQLTSTEEGKAFVKATDNRISSTRMEDRDFVNRFVAFYIIPFEEYQPDLDSFLNKGLEKIKELNQEQIAKLKQDFLDSMTISFEIFGRFAFRKQYTLNDNYRKPINKALFEVLSVNFAKLPIKEKAILIAKKTEFRQKFIELNNNDKFIRAITQGTAQKESVTLRFRYIERIIRETIST